MQSTPGRSSTLALRSVVLTVRMVATAVADHQVVRAPFGSGPVDVRQESSRGPRLLQGRRARPAESAQSDKHAAH